MTWILNIDVVSCYLWSIAILWLVVAPILAWWLYMTYEEPAMDLAGDEHFVLWPLVIAI